MEQPNGGSAAAPSGPAYYPTPSTAPALGATAPAAALYQAPPAQQPAPGTLQQPLGGVVPVVGAPAYAQIPAVAGVPGAAPAGPIAVAGTKRRYEEASAGDAAHSSGAGGVYAAAGLYDAKRLNIGGAPAAAAAPAAVLGVAHGAAQAPVGAAAVPRETVFRLVMNIIDTALIIGRGGNTVRQIEAATGGRVKRLQEPPGAQEQVVVVWSNTKDLPSPGRTTRNAAQEALLDCVRRVVFQESAPVGQPMAVRLLVNRTQEQGVVDNMAAIVADNPGTSLSFKHHLSLPACALDNDVLLELKGERYSLMAAVETLSHVLREHPPLERPGGAPPALRALAATAGSNPGGAAAGAPAAAVPVAHFAPPAYPAAPVAAGAPYRAY